MLRARGLGVTPAESRDALRALEHVDVGDRDEVHRALRTVLASRAEDFPAFDAAFDAFWGGVTPGLPAAAPPLESGLAAPVEARFPRAKDAALEFAAWTDLGDGEGEPVGLPGLSELEGLLAKDFSTFAADELAEVERLAAQIARRLATRRSRRLKPSRRRGRVDLRRTIRLSLSRGEPVELARRRRRILKTKLVVLCDVSGSMDLYGRLLIQFLYALQNQLGRMETFVFSTRLSRVTDELREASYRKALGRLGGVGDWSGGTRIGESLRAFHQEWRRLVDRDTVVIVLSDGWDTGDPAVLSEALSQIRRRAGKLVWLNPLLGSPDYQPLTQGMTAALPHVDAFLPAHNLDSLRALARHLTP
ncbi:MAG: vWA domain-containing protein [Candidatus Rokuibacteriota bacterium]